MGETRKALVHRLFTEHGGGLRAFFRRRVGTEPDAAELAQEVYARMLRSAATEPIRNTEAYLYTVAANLVKEYRVLEQRRRTALDVDGEGLQAELAVQPDWPGEVDEARRERQLRAVLTRLSPQCRAAVALHYWQGLSYDEVARELGVTRRMVKRYLTQALADCRRRLTRLG